MLVATAACCLAAPAAAADSCRDYTRAIRSHNESVYRGFIYGHVMGFTRNREAIAVRAIADEVGRLTAKYCLEKPDADLNNVVAFWTEIVVEALKR
jgi:hypothetical protein